MDRPQRHPDAAAGARLQRLRGLRVRPERDLGLAADVDLARKGVKRRTAAEEAAARAWEAVAPDAFVATVRFVELKRKVLVVRAADAGVRYRLEAWLRGGGEATVASVAKAAIARVKVVV